MIADNSEMLLEHQFQPAITAIISPGRTNNHCRCKDPQADLGSVGNQYIQVAFSFDALVKRGFIEYVSFSTGQRYSGWRPGRVNCLASSNCITQTIDAPRGMSDLALQEPHAESRLPVIGGSQLQSPWGIMLVWTTRKRKRAISSF